MGGLNKLQSASELRSFLQSNTACVVTFSATWCGPCRASLPKLEEMAAQPSTPMPIGYILEDVLGEETQTYGIRAFPTYVIFVGGKEVERIEGVNFAALLELMNKHKGSGMPETGGNTLGGDGGETKAVSPEEARRIRLARLGASSASASTPATDDDSKPAAAPDSSEAAPMDVDAGPRCKEVDNDVDMTEEEETVTAREVPTSVVLDKLDKESLTTLTEAMGFSLIRAQKGMLYSTGKNLESAIDWLTQHQEDEDIDDPLPETMPRDANEKAQSYKCNECGRILSSMANLELHANKTGHSDFEESTQAVKPLTPEEKAAKILEIKELLKAKRAEREEEEKVDNVAREKSRRFMGKEMAKTREQMEAEQRKREALVRKREKEAFKKERARIRAELEKDKMERVANKGKLSSRLGVDGYNPDGIQYDKEEDETEGEAGGGPPKKKAAPSAKKVDDYIKKVSSYRAGGDGGKSLKILKTYIGNVADNPGEEKFKTINMENKAYLTKIKPFIGAKHLLLAVGFAPKEGDPTKLVLQDDADQQLLIDTKAKLEAAFKAFG